MLKKTPFEKKVIGLLMVVVIFVSATALLVFINLRSIISEITEEARPDQTLIIMKEMLYDISDAENSVKSYSLTRDVAYLDQFGDKTTEVDNKIQQLRELTKGNENHSNFVDSLEYLTKGKFSILEDLLILQDQFSVDKVLDKVIQNIHQAEVSDKVSQGEQTEVSEEDVANNSGQNETVTDPNPQNDQEEVKKGFFKRLFDKRKKEAENEKDEAVLSEENSSQATSEENTDDQIEENSPSVDASFYNLGQEVSHLKVTESKHQEELRIQEYMLIQQDKMIMDRIMAIFELMEEEESSSMQSKLDEAESSSTMTEYLVAGFCLLVSILLAFAAYTIFKYVQRNNAYKKALKAAKDETELKNREITDSIHYAQRIQNAILPDDKKIENCLPNSFILYKPKDIVAGDFYWMMRLKDKVLFAVADCTGHGVPGAMVSVVCHNALNRSVREFGETEPAKILEKTRELVIETLEEGGDTVSDGMDIALCSLDTKTHMLEYAGANNSLYLIKNNNLQEVKADKQPVGRFAHMRPFTNHKIGIEKGDRIFLYTDGFADQFGGQKGKKFKYKAFRELLTKTSDNTLKVQKDTVNASFDKWMGDLEQVDDVCLIGVEL